MATPEKNNSRDLKSRLFQFATLPYRHWLEKRQFAQELSEMQHRIATDANKELLQFHEEVWSHWPEAAQRVRQQIHRKETFHE